MSEHVQLSSGKITGGDGTNVSVNTYTQTYSTASRTVATPTAAAVAATSATSSTPYGYSQAQADAIVTNLNAVIADALVITKVVTALIDDLQALGLVT